MYGIDVVISYSVAAIATNVLLSRGEDVSLKPIKVTVTWGKKYSSEDGFSKANSNNRES